MQVLIPEQSLLQGVSQQPRHLRKQGQVQALLNMYPDVQRGLRRRNGTVLLEVVPSAWNFQQCNIENINIAGIPFVLLHNVVFGGLLVLTARMQTLADTSAEYLQGAKEDFQYVVYNETLIVLNRKRIVERIPASTAAYNAQGGNRRWHNTGWTYAPAAWVEHQQEAREAVPVSRSFFYAKSSDVHLAWSVTLVKDYVTRTIQDGKLKLHLWQRVYTCSAQNGSGTESQDGFITGSYYDRLADMLVSPSTDWDWAKKQQSPADTVRQQRAIYEYIKALSQTVFTADSYAHTLSIPDPLDSDKFLSVELQARTETKTGKTNKIPNTGLFNYHGGSVWLTRGTAATAVGIISALSECWGFMQSERLGGNNRAGSDGSLYEDLIYTRTNEHMLVQSNKLDEDTICIPSLYTNLGKTYAVASGSAYNPNIAAIEDLPPTLSEWMLLSVGRINPEYYEYSTSEHKWVETSLYPQELTNIPRQYQLVLPKGMYEQLREDAFQSFGSIADDGQLKDISVPTSMFAGDAKSNPDPEFVGSAINGIAVYQGRLVLLNSDGVFFSATNKPQQFYRETVKDVQDSDPISVYNPQAAGNWRWATEFNQDLYIFGQDVQALIRGRNGLTSKNAALLFNSRSYCNVDVEPIVQGTTLLFSASKNSLDIRQMLTGAVADTATTPTSITQHCQNLGSVRKLIAHDSSGLLFAFNDNGKVLVQCSIKDGVQYLQNAWGVWTFTDVTILGIACYAHAMYWYCLNTEENLELLQMQYPQEETEPVDARSGDNYRTFESYVELAAPSVRSGDNLLMQADACARWVQAYLHVSTASEFQYKVLPRQQVYQVSSQYLRQGNSTKSTGVVPVLIQGDADSVLHCSAKDNQGMTLLGVASTVRTKQTIRQL